MFLVRALTGLHLDLRVLFSQQVGPQGDFFTCTSCLGWLGLSFELQTVLSYLVDISLGSSHRVFLRRALMGLHLDLRALFSQQVAR